MDSTKLLTEKLALARELSSLKPEVDHLRSQTALHQNVLAEKLSLQRQLSKMQVELEMEKRATQRALAKEEKLQVEDAKTAAQLGSLQAELVEERKERLKVERQVQKVSADWETRRLTLESRLDSLKTQLKATKDQLKENQSELRGAQAAPRPGATRSNSDIALNETTKEPRKRIASRMDDDTIIGTPGDLRATKKTKRGSTMPGDKSTFSITPFLNRTASVAPGSILEDSGSSKADNDDDIGGRPPIVANGHQSSSTTVANPSEKPKSGKATQIAYDASFPDESKRKKTIVKAPAVRKPHKAPVLGQVTEEEHDGNAGPKNRLKSAAEEDSRTGGDITGLFEVRKRKRKLLGDGLAKTLFGDDDGEVVKGEKAGVRTFGTLGRVALRDPKANQRSSVAGSANGFGSFSPLKKDRMARG